MERCKGCVDRQRWIAGGNHCFGVPCVTIRENTERPITIKMGTNILAGTKKESILKAFEEADRQTQGPIQSAAEMGWQGGGEDLENTT